MGSGAPIVEELVLLLRDGAQVGQAVTDDGGRYELLVLADGDYTVALASEAHGTASRALSVTVPTDSTGVDLAVGRSEEHTSELQSLLRNSYAVSCLKTKNKQYLYIYN